MAAASAFRFIQPKHEAYFGPAYFRSFGLLTGTIASHGQPVRVYSHAGSIFIERGGGTTKLTASEMDIDPVLSPNGAFVV